jgi:hypothetical protein
MGTRIKVSLAKCGTCGKRYSNPLTHVCVTRIGQRQQRTKIRPRVSKDCSRCGKPVGNPLTHVCKTRTDFKSRLAAQKRSKAKRRGRASKQGRPAQQQHDYRSCRDEACERQRCQVYREGFEAGVENCPREHGG